jgi:hypothetical protein
MILTLDAVRECEALGYLEGGQLGKGGWADMLLRMGNSGCGGYLLG